MNASFIHAADLLMEFSADLKSGTPPVTFRVGVDEFDPVELGPGRIVLLGAPPGQGKTALVMQWAIDALRLQPEVKVAVANVEMSPAALLNRQLARLSGIEARIIRQRRLGSEHSDRIDAALATLKALAERLFFMSAPFSLSNVAATADECEADVLILDYIQRFSPPDAAKHRDKRSAVNAMMDSLRRFSDAGKAILVVAAVGRVRNAGGGSSYSGRGLNLASFRETSELEYGADSALLLVPDEDSDNVILRCEKNRDGELFELPLAFDRSIQRFTPEPTGTPSARSAKKKSNEAVKRELKDAWAQTRSAADSRKLAK